MSMFLIDLGRPAVFVHIPKTGGTSIRKGRQLSGPELFHMPRAWARYPSLAFVRDPFDRAESAWRYARFVRCRTDLSFVEWLHATHAASEEEIANPRTMAHHAAPMTHPVHGLRHAGFVGDFSTLQRDFNAFCDANNLRASLLPHERDTGDAPRAPRTEQTLALVRQLYADDYARLERMAA